MDCAGSTVSSWFVCSSKKAAISGRHDPRPMDRARSREFGNSRLRLDWTTFPRDPAPSRRTAGDHSQFNPHSPRVSVQQILGDRSRPRLALQRSIPSRDLSPRILFVRHAPTAPPYRSHKQTRAIRWFVALLRASCLLRRDFRKPQISACQRPSLFSISLTFE